ncbi:MAG: formylglycine-generating enzyme family protein [Polyangiaceae bacterium]|nr:formylglycine-generating enzyme family protein [Polyangiaceae bacterium]
MRGSLLRNSLGAFVLRSSFAAPATTVELTAASIPTNSAFGYLAGENAPVEDLLAEGDRPLPMNGLCPGDMASIDDRFCVDKYEASLVEVLPDGHEEAWPYYKSVEGHTVRAISQKGVYPQGYISERQAILACGLSGKRLCKPAEWKKACQGPESKKFGYGDERKPGICNDHGRSPVGFYYHTEVMSGAAWTWDKMNDPQLNQLAGTLAETGSHEECTNDYGVHDMVGNVHEWVDDPAGTFQGGYYLDVTQNGDGCNYRTEAHIASYHDYSTGFRCCADIGQ